jgi:para-aminobenzoate synthetase/4-amino-4-deoxychorismate lyase
MIRVVLESLAQDTKNVSITNPELVLQTHDLSEVSSILRQVEEAVADGYVAAGIIAYEAGYHFLPGMPRVSGGSFPLVWFALSRKYGTEASFAPGEGETATVTDLALDTTLREYTEAIETIRSQIEEGNTYQVNFTIRYRGRLNGSPAALYRELRTKQRVAYAAYIETPDWSVLSLSPELFYRKRDKQIWARPMKGTSPRGRTLQEDAERSVQLAGSDKERAENLMIVDLLRNDLGKICEPGSIRVSRPLIVERYDTVLQMTSEIEGRTRKDLSLLETMQALFPSGSVTGAPKLRTMQIIRRLEKSPRGVFC